MSEAKAFKENRYKTELTRYRVECAGKLTGKILDVAGGVGAYLPYFGSDDVTVLDISEEAIRRNPCKNKVVGDACHMPFEADTFDNVWCCGGVIYFPEDVEVFIKEASRVTKKGGKIWICVPNPDNPYDWIKTLIRMKKFSDDEAPFFHMYSKKELERYGTLTGEVRFFPAFLDKMIRRRSWFWNTMMLVVEV